MPGNPSPHCCRACIPIRRLASRAIIFGPVQGPSPNQDSGPKNCHMRHAVNSDHAGLRLREMVSLAASAPQTDTVSTGLCRRCDRQTSAWWGSVYCCYTLRSAEVLSLMSGNPWATLRSKQAGWGRVGPATGVTGVWPRLKRSSKSSTGVVIWPRWTELNSFSTGPAADTKFSILTVLISAIRRHSRHCFYVAAPYSSLKSLDLHLRILIPKILQGTGWKPVAILPLTGLATRKQSKAPTVETPQTVFWLVEFYSQKASRNDRLTVT